MEKKYKYFIGYLYDDYKIKPLYMLPKTSAYVKDYDEKTKGIYFFIKDDDLLNKYNTIWDKIRADAKTELNDEPAYNKHI